MELAVLDLGSTTFHLQHFRVGGDGGLESCLDEKTCTGLGSQVFATGYIDDKARDEAVAAIDALLRLSDQRGFVERRIVATSAIRSASNGAALTQAIAERHRCSVAILSPHDEAWLAYAGQLGEPRVAGRRFAMVDLGGGSVELSFGEGDRLLFSESLPLGAVRMRTTLGYDVLDSAQLEKLKGLLHEQLSGPMQALRRLAPELYLFGSGSARAVRKLLARASSQPGKSGPLETAGVREELAQLLGRSPDELIALGVEPARSTTVLTAAAIMLQIMELAGVADAYVSNRGLRHGVARDMLLGLSRDSGVFRRDALLEAVARTASGL